MRFAAPLFLLLASCGAADEAPEADNVLELPIPSGPPVAQQVEAVRSSAPRQDYPAWESAASGEGTALRLTGAGGKLLLSIACLGSPARLAATAPGFTITGSEDRFSLGLGDEPVTLVADLSAAKAGVTAEGIVPGGLAGLLAKAEQISALYGTQQIGPVAAPPEALKHALAKSCTSK